MSTLKSHLPVLLSLAALTILPALGQAAPGTAPKPPVRGAAPAGAMQARSQVDGMADRVVDNLWRTTDPYWHAGDYNRIVALARVCVEADPAFYEAWSTGAWLLWSMGDGATAETFLREGVRRNPDAGEMQFELGSHLFHHRKRPDAALPHLQAAVRFADAPVTAWKTLGHCYERLNRLDEAVAVWKTVTTKFPEDLAGAPNLRRVTAKRAAQTASPPL